MTEKHRILFMASGAVFIALFFYRTNESIGHKIPKIMPQNRTPENTRLLFDFDDVILTFPKGALKKFFWENSWKLIKNPRLAWNMGLMKKRGASGAEYVRLCQRYNVPGLEKALEELVHSKVPMPGMTQRLQHLHAAGFQLDGGSNMYEEDYLFYKEKYPELFSLLTNVKVIRLKPGLQPIKKPDPAFFKEYEQEFPSAKNTLFFDDKPQNASSAASLGFTSRVFEGREQFDKDIFDLLGIEFRPHTLGVKPLTQT